MKPQRMANWPPLKSCCSRCLASLLSFGMPAAGRERGAARPRTSLGGGGRRSEGTLPGAKSRSLLGGGGRGPPSSAPGPFLCPGMPLHAAPCRGWKRQRYTDACSAPKRWWRWKFVACSLLLRYGQVTTYKPRERSWCPAATSPLSTNSPSVGDTGVSWWWDDSLAACQAPEAGEGETAVWGETTFNKTSSNAFRGLWKNYCCA